MANSENVKKICQNMKPPLIHEAPRLDQPTTGKYNVATHSNLHTQNSGCFSLSQKALSIPENYPFSGFLAFRLKVDGVIKYQFQNLEFGPVQCCESMCNFQNLPVPKYKFETIFISLMTRGNYPVIEHIACVPQNTFSKSWPMHFWLFFKVNLKVPSPT